MKKITATDYYNYTQCKYSVYLEKYGDESKKDKVSDFVRLLWNKGIQHEDQVIEGFIKSKGKSFNEIDKNKPAGKGTFLETINLMKKGVDYIYQGVLMSDNLVGRPDLLEKIEGNSKFGDYHYIPVDIKAGKGYRGNDFENGEINESYWLQLVFYNLLLSKIQNYTPSYGKIINIKYSELEYKTDLNNPKFNKISKQIIDMVNGKELYQPVIGSGCDKCRWKTYCRKWAEKKNDLSLLLDVSEGKYDLQEYGIMRIEDILKDPLDKWLKELPKIKKEGYFKGIAEKSFVKLYKRAEVYKNGKEIFYSFPNFPNSDIEIHFDIEDDPIQDKVYLFGFWIRELSNGKDYYKYFMAQNVDEEEKIVKELWKFLGNHKRTPIYHYFSTEISVLKKLQKKYDMDPEIIDQIKNNSVDLHKIIKKCSDWPLTSYGLKSICKFIGFKWSSEDAGGANSIEWFSRFLSGEKEMKDKILQYNEEDCRATAYLKDYIISKNKTT